MLLLGLSGCVMFKFHTVPFMRCLMSLLLVVFAADLPGAASDVLSFSLSSGISGAPAQEQLVDANDEENKKNDDNHNNNNSGE